MTNRGSKEDEATVFGGNDTDESIPPSDFDRTIFSSDLPSPSDPVVPADDATVFGGDRTEEPADRRGLSSHAGIAPSYSAERPDPAERSDPADRSDPTYDPVDRTAHAMAAVELGTLFRHRFSKVTFGMSPRYEIMLNAPDGPSTAGGTLARQSLVLFREGSGGERGVVIGWIDAAATQAVLRSHELLGRHFELRFKHPIDIIESEYERLLDALRRFADSQGLTVRMLEQENLPVRSGGTLSRPKRGTRQFGLREVLLVLVAILGVGMFLGYLMAQ